MVGNKRVIDYVVDQLALGRGLLSISKDKPQKIPSLNGIEKMPNESTLRDWALRDEETGARYASARLLGNESDFERLDEWAEEKPPKLDNGAIDNGWNNWNRTRIDTKKWSLAKRQPGRYGDRIEHDYSNMPAPASVPVTVIDASLPAPLD